MKYGLWEDGKRIEWFDEQMAQSIMKGKESYKKFFKREESFNFVNEAQTFNKPHYFDNKLTQVIKKFGLMAQPKAFYNNY